MLLVSLNRIYNVSYPFSPRTFIKHLQTTIPAPSFKSIRKAVTTSSSLKSSHFETLNPHQKDQIHLYVEALLQWNQKMNLTAVTEASEVMERHIEDSLAIIPPIRSSYLAHCESSFENLNLVDVGSGAGLPGLILAIACPGWRVTLLESMNKRCMFLKNAVDLTGLSNVEVVRGRAEDVGQNLGSREVFDVAVARAVAEMRILAEYCLPLVRVGGLFVAAKGHDPQEEVRRAEKAINLMGASLLQTCSVESHGPYGQRTAIICYKVSPTPRQYPRDPEGTVWWSNKEPGYLIDLGALPKRVCYATLIIDEQTCSSFLGGVVATYNLRVRKNKTAYVLPKDPYQPFRKH